jgi:F-type H+-transporting ATPase subunit epsilon
MPAEKKLHVMVVTPSRTVLNDDAASVVVPAFDGEWGVLPGHAALMALLGCGRLTVSRADGTRRYLTLRGGFLQVKDDAVTILTPEAVAVNELDAAAVHDEVELLKATHPPPAEREAHEQKLAWAQARRKAIERARAEARN